MLFQICMYICIHVRAPCWCRMRSIKLLAWNIWIKQTCTDEYRMPQYAHKSWRALTQQEKHLAWIEFFVYAFVKICDLTEKNLYSLLSNVRASCVKNEIMCCYIWLHDVRMSIVIYSRSWAGVRYFNQVVLVKNKMHDWEARPIALCSQIMSMHISPCTCGCASSLRAAEKGYLIIMIMACMCRATQYLTKRFAERRRSSGQAGAYHDSDGNSLMCHDTKIAYCLNSFISQKANAPHWAQCMEKWFLERLKLSVFGTSTTFGPLGLFLKTHRTMLISGRPESLSMQSIMQ